MNTSSTDWCRILPEHNDHFPLNEQWFRSFAENLPHPVIRYDGMGRYAWLNIQAGALVRTLISASASSQLEMYNKRLHQVLRTLKAAEVELSLDTLPGGERREFRISFMPEFDNGALAGVLAIGEDITSRKRAEEALRQSEEKLAWIFDVSQVALSIYSLDRKVYREANRSFLEHTGFSREEVVGRPGVSFWADQEERTFFFEELLESGKVGGMEFRYRRKGRDAGVALAFGTLTDLDGERCILGENYDITRQKLLEETARAHEKMLYTLTENFPGFVYTFQLGPDGSEAFLFVSPGIREIYGLEPDAVLADISVLRNIMRESDRADFRAAIAESARTGEMLCREFRIIHPRKGERWLETRSMPEAQPEGSTIWHGVTLDVSDRKKMEEELRMSRACYRTIFESANDGIFLRRIVETEGGTEFVLHDLNRKGCELWGCSREEALAGTIDLLLAVGEASFNFEEATHRNLLAAAGEPQLFEWRLLRKDGTKVWGEVNLKRTRIGDEDFLLAVIRDITERKEAEITLARKGREFRTLADNSPDVIVRYDRDLKRVYANPSWEKANGIPASQVLGKSPRERAVLVASWAEEYEARLRNVLVTGEDNRFDVRWEEETGKTVTFDLRAVPEREGEEITGILVFAREITERKERESELRRLNRALRMISGCNMLLAHADDEKQLLAEICRLIVETGGYQASWVGIADRSDTKNVAPVAHFGVTGMSLQELAAVWEDGGYAAISTGKIVVRNLAADPDIAMFGRYDRAWRLGLRAALALPLKNGSEILGVLNIYAEEGSCFGAEEVQLLEEFAGNLSFGIVMIRLRLERARMEAEIRSRERSFRALAENSPDTIARYDRACVRIYVNRTFARLTGLEPEALLGKKPTDYNPSPEAAAYEAILAVVIDSGRMEELQYTWPDASGNRITSHIRMVPEYDESGNVVSVLATGRDITRMLEIQAKMEHLAQHDVLTGLPNRQTVQERTNRAIAAAQRHEGKVALLFVDLDNFKAVNDSLGHDTGDMLLKKVSDRLQSCVREIDTVGRQGGDEFVIALSEIDGADDIVQIVSRIFLQFEQPLLIDDHSLFTSMSIGIAMFPNDGDDFDTLLKKADAAMYEAKAAGRNTHSFFSPQMNRSTLEHLMMHNDLKRALNDEELLLHFQPQIDVNSGGIAGAEVLLRWQHPEAGMVFPGRFIPVAEANGLIVPIGEWVLRKACRQAARWPKYCGHPLKVAVNISAMQFKRSNMEVTVLSALEESGLRPELLELELTESIFMNNTEQTLETVRRLKARGVRISIDDFGTGYSSLAYLKRFAADVIKIDRSFVCNIIDDADNAAIVKAVIQMAKSLGIATVAEGVEDQKTLEMLAELGCDVIQGYFFSRPVNEGDFKKFCREHTPLGH